MEKDPDKAAAMQKNLDAFYKAKGLTPPTLPPVR
jgi:hypothetical protein